MTIIPLSKAQPFQIPGMPKQQEVYKHQILKIFRIKSQVSQNEFNINLYFIVPRMNEITIKNHAKPFHYKLFVFDFLKDKITLKKNNAMLFVIGEGSILTF